MSPSPSVKCCAEKRQSASFFLVPHRWRSRVKREGEFCLTSTSIGWVTIIGARRSQKPKPRRCALLCACSYHPTIEFRPDLYSHALFLRVPHRDSLRTQSPIYPHHVTHNAPSQRHIHSVLTTKYILYPYTLLTTCPPPPAHPPFSPPSHPPSPAFWFHRLPSLFNSFKAHFPCSTHPTNHVHNGPITHQLAQSNPAFRPHPSLLPYFRQTPLLLPRHP